MKHIWELDKEIRNLKETISAESPFLAPTDRASYLNQLRQLEQEREWLACERCK